MRYYTGKGSVLRSTIPDHPSRHICWASFKFCPALRHGQQQLIRPWSGVKLLYITVMCTSRGAAKTRDRIALTPYGTKPTPRFKSQRRSSTLRFPEVPRTKTKHQGKAPAVQGHDLRANNPFNASVEALTRKRKCHLNTYRSTSASHFMRQNLCSPVRSNKISAFWFRDVIGRWTRRRRERQHGWIGRGRGVHTEIARSGKLYYRNRPSSSRAAKTRFLFVRQMYTFHIMTPNVSKVVHVNDVQHTQHKSREHDCKTRELVCPGWFPCLTVPHGLPRGQLRTSPGVGSVCRCGFYPSLANSGFPQG